jgi:hypothetical protein
MEAVESREIGKSLALHCTPSQILNPEKASGFPSSLAPSLP